MVLTFCLLGYERMNTVVGFGCGILHQDIITCLSAYHNAKGHFFSGSRDCSVRLWDARSPTSAAIFGQTGKESAIVAHDGMLTCVDSNGYLLATGGLDKKVKIWDLRTVSASGCNPIRQIPIDDTVVLKVALGLSGSYAAVSTLSGLYLADVGTGSFTRSLEFSDRRTIRRYHDLAWSDSVLYAAGDDCRVDVYNIGSGAAAAAGGGGGGGGGSGGGAQ